jgi:hypothetical protein
LKGALKGVSELNRVLVRNFADLPEELRVFLVGFVHHISQVRDYAYEAVLFEEF